MATLQEIDNEVKTTSAPCSADLVRRKHLKNLHRLTGRATILYASAYAIRDDLPGEPLSIARQDIQGFMSALNGVKGDALGPIDPQLILPFSGGVRAVPAQSILDEFDEAQTTINNPANNPLMWVKRIGDYPPGILADCRKVSELSRTLVRGWLEERMFAGDPEGVRKAKDLADWLGNNKNFLSHGRAIGIELARKQGFLVDALEDNQKFQEAALTTFHATAATFRTTNCAKLVENHLGRGLYTRIHVQRA